MYRFLSIVFLAFSLVACSGDKEGVVPLSREERNYAFFTSGETRMPSVDYFTPSFYNIELIEIDTLHPVMQITYMSRRQAGDDYRWVDAVLRLDITQEQRAQLHALLYDEVLSSLKR